MIKLYRVYLGKTYFGSYHFSAEALRRVGATVKGNRAYFPQ